MIPVDPIPYNFQNVVNHCATSTPADAQTHLGYGKYRVTIAIDQQNFNFNFDVDFSDSDYPGTYASQGLDRDIFLVVRSSPLRVFWLSGITPSSEYQLINGDLIQLWDQRRINGPNAIKTQNKSGFKIPNISDPVPDTNIPLGTHTDKGNLFVNTTLQGNVTISSNVTIAAGATLTIASGTTITINPGVTVYVEGTLSIPSNATITGGGTIVKQGSGVILATNSAEATAFNNNRRLVRDSSGNYHLVFETEGEICYEKWISGGTAECGACQNPVGHQHHGAGLCD